MSNFKMKSKLIVISIAVLLIFTLVPTVAAAKSTKLVFNASEFVDLNVPPPMEIFGEGRVLHVKDFWSRHQVFGTIGDDEIIGYTLSLFHVKWDLVSGNRVLNGETLFNFTWYYSTDDLVVELKGYFAGTVNAKLVDGVVSGKFSLQGYEDFKGMKLFGTIEPLPPLPYVGNNLLIGVVLIPN